MKIKKLISVILVVILLEGCVSIFKTGVPIEKYNKYVTGEANRYIIELDNGQDITIDTNIGMCGGGVTISILPIPFILPIPINHCEKNDFQIKPSYSSQNDIYLKYNGKIYESNNVLEKKFKIKNFKEFKKAKDKTIIITEDGKVIKEIPFEWRWNIW